MKKKKISIGEIFKDWALLILLVGMIIVFSIGSEQFLSLLNMKNILIQNSYIAILSMGTCLLMICGNIDLSQGYQISTIAVVTTMLITKFACPVPVGILVGILIGVACSVANMWLSHWFKAHPMIITLATMAILEGVSYTVSASKTFNGFPKAFLFIGQGTIGVIPFNIILMVIIVVFVSVLLGKTYIGKRIYACGDNPEAARLAGIKVTKIKFFVFVIAGVFVGIAGILLASRSGSANSSTGVGVEFTAITACVLGGVALKGGEGKPWKVLIAAYVLGVLSNGMQFIGLGTYVQFIAKGILMLFSVGLSNNAFMIKRKAKQV